MRGHWLRGNMPPMPPHNAQGSRDRAADARQVRRPGRLVLTDVKAAGSRGCFRSALCAPGSGIRMFAACHSLTGKLIWSSLGIASVKSAKL